MSQKQRDFNILFRKPKYLLIVISVDKLMAAFNIKELAACCISDRPAKVGNLFTALTDPDRKCMTKRLQLLDWFWK